jgi:UDP-glucose 4-epimerase
MLEGQTVGVTGASGFIGRAVVEALERSGAKIRTISRSRLQHECTAENRIHDLSDPMTPNEIFVGCDLVVHLAASVIPLQSISDVENSETVKIARVVGERLAKANVQKIIVLSSIAARVAEQTPEYARPYGLEKLAADEVIKAALNRSQKSVFLCPPAIYGEGMQGSLAMLGKLVVKGIPLPFGMAKKPRDYLSRSNLADLVVSIAAADDDAWRGAAGQSYAPCDGQPLGTADLICLIGAAQGKKAKLLPVPRALISIPASLAGKVELARSVFEGLNANDNAALKKIFGWTPFEKMPESLGFLTR